MLGLPDEVSACLFDMDGVEAGPAGRFALVGADRVGQVGKLSRHGAGIVPPDLADLLGKDDR
jgi:hypothetical protein